MAKFGESLMLLKKDILQTSLKGVGGPCACNFIKDDLTKHCNNLNKSLESVLFREMTLLSSSGGASLIKAPRAALTAILRNHELITGHTENGALGITTRSS
jgi:hypothetical protein